MLQIIIIVLTVAADQLTKYFLVPLIPDGGSITVIPGVFDLSYTYNEGASFGMLQGFQILFIIVTIIVLAAGGVYMIKTRHKQPLFLKICLSLVIGGAVGNFIDRVATAIAAGISNSHVHDFLDFRQVYFPWIFNIADACLVVGAIMLGVYVLFMHKPKDKAKDVSKAPEEKKE
jgi:signal peptidase II